MENEEEELDVQKNNAETIGNTIKETTEPMAPGNLNIASNVFILFYYFWCLVLKKIVSLFFV